MKKIIKFIVYFFVISNCFSQMVIPLPTCGGQLPSNNTIYKRNITTLVPDNPLTPYVINLSFTMINDLPNHNTAGLSSNTAVENAFLDCIRILNVNFNQHNIFFKYKGYKIVENAQISNNSFQFIVFPGVLNPPLIADNIAQYREENSINVYCVNNLYNGTSGGAAYIGGSEIFINTPMLTPNLNTGLSNLLVHEMGHVRTLFHVFEPVSHFITTDPLYNFTICEHVTRDPNNSNYNATISGDEIADTPAQPLTNDSFFQPNCGEYIFDLNKQDCQGTPYSNIIIGNHMGYGANDCFHSFTAGQVARMRKFILNNSFLYGGVETLPSFFSIVESMNTVNSLYAPFKSSKLITQTISTDNGDGTAHVCKHYVSSSFKFQPGFDYQFPNNVAPDLVSYNTSETALVVSHAFNCPLVILQLAPSQTNLSSNLGNAFTVCRGVDCTDETYRRGIKYSTQNFGLYECYC
jgi:hypothetical protein